MDLLSNLSLGFSLALSLQNVFFCFVGAVLGTVIGVLPGIGPVVGISLLLPLTFGMKATSAVIMLAGIYYGAAYGGSTTPCWVGVYTLRFAIMGIFLVTGFGVIGYFMKKQKYPAAPLLLA